MKNICWFTLEYDGLSAALRADHGEYNIEVSFEPGNPGFQGSFYVEIKKGDEHALSSEELHSLESVGEFIQRFVKANPIQ